MAKYESGVKQIPYAQTSVYAKLSDLTNLAALKEKMNDPAAQEMMEGRVDDEQRRQAQQVLEQMEVTRDSLTIPVPMLGTMSMQVVERDEPKCVKFESVQSPIPFLFWIQLLPTSDTSCKMKLTLDAELNMMFKMMLGSKLKDGIDKFADMLAMIPYED